MDLLPPKAVESKTKRLMARLGTGVSITCVGLFILPKTGRCCPAI